MTLRRGEEDDDSDYEHGCDPDPKMVAHEIFSQYAGGKTIGRNIQWVLRAMHALERHYHALRRDDGKRRARLDKLVSQLSERLEETAEGLATERRLRGESEAELARVRVAFAPGDMVQVRDGQAGDLEMWIGYERGWVAQQTVEREHQYRAALDGCEAQLALTQERYAQADAAAHYWAQRAAEAQEQARAALQESQEARAAKVALQKCLIREKDYKLSEEAGYQLDAVVQIAPMRPTITVFAGAARRPPDANTHLLDPWRKGTL